MTSVDGTCSGILVVDDNADLLKTLVEVLTDEGYLVTTARDGGEALATLHSAALLPCVILLDLTMPGMNGEQFRSKQLADPTLASIPVLGFTADPTNHERLRAMNVAAVVPKPVSLETLLAILARYCDVVPR